ncbi:DUF992 domain-containing protein [Rhizobium tumorigenes]|uniref:DUF992 domain-containing protein n=1 Tax=Rhizobium tumorigenes TaxID=2041385 RepID=UPI00241EB255|nr:DUF992 domain-containing protein [Rhizobium tumorigenes]WFS02145.1 DUF992 domain-containing protein [Rhizobium tumorigenes]
MKNLVIIAATAAVVFASVADAAPRHKGTGVVATQPKERLGTLSCTVAGGVGMIFGSSKAVSCEFKQRNGKAEHYVGSIGKLGIDIGVTGKAYLSWLVYNVNPTRTGEGALAGNYVGASAGASVGIGLGANALVGGSSKNFGLQPLSGETSTGLNVAAGVAQLNLRLAK